MGDKLTSVYITTALRYMENELISATGLSRAMFHRKALDMYINGSHEIRDEYKIVSKSDPNYVQRTYLERIYIDNEREAILKNIAQEQDVKYSIIIFQALCDYCVNNVELLNSDILKNIELGNYEV